MLNKTQITVLNLNTIMKQLLTQHVPLFNSYTLLGKNKNSTLRHFPDVQLCKQFEEYFKEQINTICKILSCTFKPLYNAPQILPCTSTLTHFTLPTNTAIYNYIVTARCSSSHDPIPLYLIKLAKTLILTYKNIIDDSPITGNIPNLLKNVIITPKIKNLILTHQNSQITSQYLNYLIN